jgi:hypothetical protein
MAENKISTAATAALWQGRRDADTRKADRAHVLSLATGIATLAERIESGEGDASTVDAVLAVGREARVEADALTAAAGQAREDKRQHAANARLAGESASDLIGQADTLAVEVARAVFVATTYGKASGKAVAAALDVHASYVSRVKAIGEGMHAIGWTAANYRTLRKAYVSEGEEGTIPGSAGARVKAIVGKAQEVAAARTTEGTVRVSAADVTGAVAALVPPKVDRAHVSGMADALASFVSRVVDGGAEIDTSATEDVHDAIKRMRAALNLLENEVEHRVTGVERG